MQPTGGCRPLVGCYVKTAQYQRFGARVLTVVCFASHDSSHTTGAELVVDAVSRRCRVSIAGV